MPLHSTITATTTTNSSPFWADGEIGWFIALEWPHEPPALTHRFQVNPSVDRAITQM